jgi:acetylornithine deacetylase/succinyl-diaminopimelate desuccinylase-like protein
MDTEDLRTRVSADMPRTIDELSRLVAIPSIGYPGHDPDHVRRSAETTQDIVRRAGAANARLLEIPGAHPAVFASVPGPEDAPTALLYAHHDVQPEGDPSAWTTPPYDPQVRDGRLYGRGAADDKSGIAVHAAALRALGVHEGAGPPCTIKILVEGEEECSTEHLPELVLANAELLRADVAIVADGGNHRTGVPTIGTSVRGSTSLEVRVDVLPAAVHSGAYGGPLPDAITALARIVASLHDERGDVAVRGLHAFAWPGTPVSEEDFREESGVFDDVELLGTGTIADRTLSRPSINVLAFESVDVVDAANQIVPTARAVIGLRVAPGQDRAAAIQLLEAHVRAHAPWGVRVSTHGDGGGDGYMVDSEGRLFEAARRALCEAFGADVLAMGSGGSIPLVAMLARAVPGIQILIVGAGDDRSRYHSVDESVDLGDLERLALAEALLLRELASAR